MSNTARIKMHRLTISINFATGRNFPFVISILRFECWFQNRWPLNSFIHSYIHTVTLTEISTCAYRTQYYVLMELYMCYYKSSKYATRWYMQTYCMCVPMKGTNTCIRICKKWYLEFSSAAATEPRKQGRASPCGCGRKSQSCPRPSRRWLRLAASRSTHWAKNRDRSSSICRSRQKCGKKWPGDSLLVVSVVVAAAAAVVAKEIIIILKYIHTYIHSWYFITLILVPSRIWICCNMFAVDFSQHTIDLRYRQHSAGIMVIQIESEQHCHVKARRNSYKW